LTTVAGTGSVVGLITSTGALGLWASAVSVGRMLANAAIIAMLLQAAWMLLGIAGPPWRNASSREALHRLM
jgi:hypothetical protein